MLTGHVLTLYCTCPENAQAEFSQQANVYTFFNVYLNMVHELLSIHKKCLYT